MKKVHERRYIFEKMYSHDFLTIKMKTLIEFLTIECISASSTWTNTVFFAYMHEISQMKHFCKAKCMWVYGEKKSG